MISASTKTRHTRKQQNERLGEARLLSQGPGHRSWPCHPRHRFLSWGWWWWKIFVEQAADRAWLCQAAGTEIQGRVSRLQQGHVQLGAVVTELLS